MPKRCDEVFSREGLIKLLILQFNFSNQFRCWLIYIMIAQNRLNAMGQGLKSFLIRETNLQDDWLRWFECQEVSSFHVIWLVLAKFEREWTKYKCQDNSELSFCKSVSHTHPWSTRKRQIPVWERSSPFHRIIGWKTKYFNSKVWTAFIVSFPVRLIA